VLASIRQHHFNTILWANPSSRLSWALDCPRKSRATATPPETLLTGCLQTASRYTDGKCLDSGYSDRLVNHCRIGATKARTVVSLLAVWTLQPLRMEVLHQPRHGHLFIHEVYDWKIQSPYFINFALLLPMSQHLSLVVLKGNLQESYHGCRGTMQYP